MIPGYREEFLAILDVARTGAKIGTPEWRTAFDRLKQFQAAWRKTQMKFTLIALAVGALAAFGLSVLLERAGVLGGDAISLVYISAAGIAAVVSHALARTSFENATGIPDREMHVAEVILDRFKRER